MKLFRTKTFKKEYFKANITDAQYVKYLKYLVLLLEENPLPPESKDHALNGEYIGFREFHLGGDLLVIYMIENNILRMARIGSHSQLFK